MRGVICVCGQVKYRRGLQELRGRSCTELDTPEYRRVRKSQDSVSMVAKYHEDFERARGRGCTPGLDDPSMERYQRANQMMGEAAYSKGIHPQAMEMDRRTEEPVVGDTSNLKVWRTDPGSIFDFDPLEDNIQSKSLRRMSGSSSKTCRLTMCFNPLSGYKAVVLVHPFSALMHRLTLFYLIPSSPRVYRALYDYAAQDHDEVSFRDGDVIVNAQPIDEGWMYGTVQRTGKSGMLPANYVEFCN
uniref:SH3 domain-containing protein n=1 Tax=Stegastes partitus TaxID=144197 RepID=A0A3B5B6R0_9TELE